MALQGMSRLETIDYESVRDPDRGNAKATRFFLHPLDVVSQAQLNDASTTVTTDGQIAINSQKNAVDCVRRALHGWANFRDEKGNDIPFTTVERETDGRRVKLASDDALEHLGLELIRELAGQVRSFNRVSKVEAGNSDAA